MVRHNNRLPDNLPQLQNLIKRDPQSYKDEFLQQHSHFNSMLEVFSLKPDTYLKGLDDLVMFIAQVASCYPDELKKFPQQIMDILTTHHTILHTDMRMTFCKALILLRNKNLLEPTDLLSLFFQLLRCQDKTLREFLETHIVTDIKNTNARQKNSKLNSTLQNFMFGMLKDNNARAAKMSLNIMIELYKKNVWNDAKTVNVIATACFSKFTKVMVTALKFFLGSDEEKKKGSGSDSDSDDEIDPKEVMMANKVNKKTRKRKKQLEKVKTLVKKSKKKKEKAPVFNFSALHLLHDPQTTAERLFKRVEASNERFEVRIMVLEVISRLIGIHQLLLLNYYPYIQRYLQPHQREVTKMLQFIAQASHELVPPELLESVVTVIVNNFVTERNSSDVMAIGLNSIREVCSRCPLAMNKELLSDLVLYRNYRDRSVMMAAKSLIQLYRTSVPEMLHRKNRGKPTEAILSLKTKQFGDIDAKDHVPGAEVLLEEKKDNQASESDSDEEGSWIDVSHSENEDNEEVIAGDDDDGESEADDEEEDDSCEEESSDEDKEEMEDDGESTKTKKETPDKRKMENTNKNRRKSVQKEKKVLTKEEVEEKVKQAAQASIDRILTDEDFKRIDAAQIRKQMSSIQKGQKRSHDETLPSKKDELVPLADIENIFKKRKHNKEQRIQSVRAGQEGREKYGFKDRRLNPDCSKTNSEKRKNKAYMMIKYKVRGKIKRSFKDKQIALRNHLLKMKKMK